MAYRKDSLSNGFAGLIGGGLYGANEADAIQYFMARKLYDTGLEPIQRKIHQRLDDRLLSIRESNQIWHFYGRMPDAPIIPIDSGMNGSLEVERKALLDAVEKDDMLN